MSDHNAHASTEKPSLLSNILAIIGLIILVIIIVWGLVHLAQLSSGWFTSLFAPSAPTLQISAPSDATSGAPVTVSWNYSRAATTSGMYAFLYQCQPGVEFALINPSNNTASGIQCGNAITVTPSDSSIAIVPFLSATSSTAASVPFSVIFTPTTGAQVQGSATMTIHPSSDQTPPSATSTGTQPGQTAGQTTTTQPAQTATTKPATAAYVAPRAPADLSVRIVSEYVDQYGNGTVTFNVANVGGTTSGTYYFSAEMPTRGTVTPYTSSLQAPLTPGSYIVDTLHFSPAISGTFSVAIGARDADQANDYASAWITAPQNYNYNYNAYGNYNPYNVEYQTGAY